MVQLILNTASASKLGPNKGEAQNLKDTLAIESQVLVVNNYSIYVQIINYESCNYYGLDTHGIDFEC